MIDHSGSGRRRFSHDESSTVPVCTVWDTGLNMTGKHWRIQETRNIAAVWFDSAEMQILLFWIVRSQLIDQALCICMPDNVARSLRKPPSASSYYPISIPLRIGMM